MIIGAVDGEGVPAIQITIGDREYRAVVDTGFNGDLELPANLRDRFETRSLGEHSCILAAGQTVVEELFLISFSFDGREVDAETSFVDEGEEILIGTGLLEHYRLEIDFPQSLLTLERTDDDNETD